MKTKLSLAVASHIADMLIAKFADNCDRIEVAGSIRRQKPEIGDLELVAIGRPALYVQLDELLAANHIRHTEHKRWGQKLRSFLFDLKSGTTVQVDMFLQTPATWGINMLLRTGSSDFSRKMVTPRSQRGFMPPQYHVKDARLWCDGVALDTPEETDVFRLYGMDYVAPIDRTDFYKPRFHAVPKAHVVKATMQGALL